jgi:hypothetical protein
MSPTALAVLVKILTSAPAEIADIKQIVSDAQAGKDVMTEVKTILADALKLIGDAGF